MGCVTCMFFSFACLVGVLVLVLVGVLVYRAPDARLVGKANRMFLFLHMRGHYLGPACLGEQQKRLGNN